MLAGLLFATHDADDRPGTLAATLPFGGVTLIEYQARLLIHAGAAQIVVVVARLTPELLGAMARIGRRGATVDAVRTAAEASAKLHPLARILVLADGLVTTEAAIAPLAREGGDALLTLDAADAPPAFERLGGRAAWAGIARLQPPRLAEVAMLPSDYDLQSALLRAAAQAGAVHVPLPAEEARLGHGIEFRGDALAARGASVSAALWSGRRAWFDRWITAPVARLVLPAAMRRALPTAAIAGGAAAVAVAALAGVALGRPALGLFLALVACIAAALGASLAWLRDEVTLARAQAIGVPLFAGAIALLLGRAVDQFTGTSTAGLLALALVIAAILADRAAAGVRRRWWATPPAYLAVLFPFALVGWPTTGLAVAATYAVATLAHGIEALRRQA